MSKDITEDILLKAVFNDIIEYTNYTKYMINNITMVHIEMIHYVNINPTVRNWGCRIRCNNGLTKCTDWAKDEHFASMLDYAKHKKERLLELHMVAFGFTLTGHDEMEPGAPSYTERIKLMKNLHTLGFKTFASIEPVIDTHGASEMITEAASYCDLFKVGLRSGVRKDYISKNELYDFLAWYDLSFENKVYWKKSVCDYMGEHPVFHSNKSVGADYNILDRT